MIPIFIPYVNRPDLLKKAFDSVPRPADWQAIVINNSGAPLPDDMYTGSINHSSPKTFSQTQNFMLERAEALGAPFYGFMHSDACAGEDTVERLIEMAYRLTDEGRRWGVIWTNYDALAMFNTEAFRAIGGFDEGFTWYASDQDVYRRIRLAGYELIDSGLPVHHEPSQTLKADPYIAAAVSRELPQRRDRYIRKWGGEAGKERFVVPFNGREDHGQ